MNSQQLELMQDRLIVHHENFTIVAQSLLRYIHHGRADQITCLLGPTGIGKTTIIGHSIDCIINSQKQGWRSDYAPPIVVEAPAQYNNSFPWKPFIEEILEALGETNPTLKVDLDEIEENRKCGKDIRSGRAMTIGKLEKLLKKRVNALKPVAIFIDESQNMVESLNEAAQRTHVNRMKNWANTMKLSTKFILVGTHEAKGFLRLNEQLTRRVETIYFPRYVRNNPEDCKHYAHLYINLIREVGIVIDQNVIEDFDYIYNHTLGCPGILASWLHTSLAYCIDKKISKISKSILQKHKFSNDRLKVIEKAIKNFEAYMESNLGDFDPSTVFADDNDQYDFDISTSQAGALRKGSILKPGQQKPKRHPVHATQPQ